MTSVYNTSQPSVKSGSATRFLKGAFRFARHGDVERFSSSALPVGKKTPSTPYSARAQPGLSTALNRDEPMYYPSYSSQSSLESISVIQAEFWTPPSRISPSISHSAPITISLPFPVSSQKVRSSKPKPLAANPPSTSSHPSPLSPTSRSNNALSDAHARKIAKLTRTFGENVPPELVFPPSTRMDNHSSPHVPKSRQSRRRNITVDAAGPTVSTEAPTRPPMHIARGAVQSKSVAPVPHSPPPFSSAFPSAQLSMHGQGVQVATWRRKEREWSGEWNIHDYEGVVKGLRGLKARK